MKLFILQVQQKNYTSLWWNLHRNTGKSVYNNKPIYKKFPKSYQISYENQFITNLSLMIIPFGVNMFIMKILPFLNWPCGCICKLSKSIKPFKNPFILESNKNQLYDPILSETFFCFFSPCLPTLEKKIREILVVIFLG